MSPDYRTPIYECPEFTIYEQKALGVMWMHCDVHKWSSSIAKHMVKAAREVGNRYQEPLFAINQPHNCQKHQKFLKLVGFEFFKTLPTLNGGEAHVFKWVGYGI